MIIKGTDKEKMDAARESLRKSAKEYKPAERSPERMEKLFPKKKAESAPKKPGRPAKAE